MSDDATGVMVFSVGAIRAMSHVDLARFITNVLEYSEVFDRIPQRLKVAEAEALRRINTGECSVIGLMREAIDHALGYPTVPASWSKR